LVLKGRVLIDLEKSAIESDSLVKTRHSSSYTSFLRVPLVGILTGILFVGTLPQRLNINE